jgi:hypothetical protein
MNCRHCNYELKQIFADLVYAPVSNTMLTKNELGKPEVYFPLRAFVCPQCFLVQVDDVNKPEDIFNESYTYYSSFSSSWLNHAKRYVDMIMQRYRFNEHSQIIEVGSNDGYLLQYFKDYNVPVLGIDPAEGTDIEAEKKGVPTISDFFSSHLAETELVKKGIKADLIIGNNVLAHDPRINDIVKGLKITLKEKGLITMEFPHLMSLVKDCQFDTIYHEHFFYLSLTSVKTIFESKGLEIFDVEELTTHGGSIRIYAKHKEDASKQVSSRVNDFLNREAEVGIKTESFYNNFQPRIEKIKNDALLFLINEKQKGKSFIGYGAAAKGNTFLNYCGIKGNEIIKFVVDASTYKQNKYLPGSHIPVVSEEKISELKPDYVILLPWNLKREIVEQLSYIRNWNGKFVIFIPELTVF